MNLRPGFQQVAYLTTGPVAAIDRCIVYYPTGRQAPKGGKRPLAIICHPAGGTVYNAVHGPWAYLIGILCEFGFVCIAADLGDPTVTTAASAAASWGNHTVADRIEAYRVWGAGLTNVDATKVALFGASMGNCSALAYARDYTSTTGAVVSTVPVFDLAYIRAQRANGAFPAYAFFGPLIDTAWGLIPSDPTPAACDLQNATPVGTPWRTYTRSGDTQADPARVPNLVARLTNAVTFSVGSGIRVVTDGVTTSGSNVLGSATANWSWMDRDKQITSSAGLAASTYIAGAPDGTHATIFDGSVQLDLPRAGAATATGAGRTFTIGLEHDETVWSQIDYNEMLSWVTPFIL